MVDRHQRGSHRGLLAALACWIAPLTLAEPPAQALQPLRPDEAPTPSVAMEAFVRVREWTTDWTLPPIPADDDAGAPSPIRGACVTFLMSGKVIGRGTCMLPDGRQHAIAIAAREAMREVSAAFPISNDALRLDNINSRNARMQISVEVASALVPVQPATFGDAELTLSPGLDGVAAWFRAPTSILDGVDTGDSGSIAAIFPSAMMLTGQLPHQALASAAAIAGGDSTLALVQPGALVDEHSARLYRFRVTHVAQVAPGAEPVFLHRGARLIDNSEMRVPDIREMLRAGAAYLERRTAPSGQVIELRESLLALLALEYAAKTLDDPALFAQVQARVAALEKDGAAIVRTDDAALWIIAGLAGDSRRSAIDTLSSVFHTVEGFAGDLPPGLRGLVALAFARAAAAELDGEKAAELKSIASAAVRRAFAETPDGKLIGQMPWLGWAELELSETGGDVPSAVALLRMRERLWENTVSSSLAPADPDLLGGVVFSSTSNPLPTWHSARALGMIGAMLADPRLTEKSRTMSEVVRLVGALRFVRQLQADESSGWRTGDLNAVLGGIRAAPWDQTVTIDATALSVIGVARSLEGLQAVSGTKPRPSGGSR